MVASVGTTSVAAIGVGAHGLGVGAAEAGAAGAGPALGEGPQSYVSSVNMTTMKLAIAINKRNFIGFVIII